jgi:NitT/TauT family transport system substrate-binding protein
MVGMQKKYRGLGVRAALLTLSVMFSHALVATKASASEIVVALWGTGMYGAPYAVAMEKGYFKQAGFDVTEIAGGAGGGSVMRNVMASAVPFGELGTPTAIAAMRQGLPIVVVGSGGSAFDNKWVTLPSSAIKSIRDLDGKRVSYANPKSISDLFLQMLLRTAGIDPARVTRVAAGSYGAGLTLLDNGAVDVAPITEPLYTSIKHKYNMIFTAKEALPPMTAAVQVTTREYAEKNPEKIKALLEGRRRGVEFIYANPVEAGKIVAKAYKTSETVTVEAVQLMATARQWSTGEVTLPEYKTIAEGMKLTGELTGDVDWKRLFDIRYLPEDIRNKSSAEIR